MSITDPGGRAGVWGARVSLGGVDISDAVFGDVTVEAEENAARLADFVWRPPLGTPLAVRNLIGQVVIVSIADLSTGVPENAQVLFTGRIERPAIDLDNRTVRLTCTDQRQSIIGAMSNADIDVLVGGYWSSVVFKKGTSAWAYSLDRLSTVAASLDLSPAGVPRLTPWAAKAVADLSFDLDHLLARPEVSFADSSSMTNSVEIKFGYRFPRVKCEGFRLDFDLLTGGETFAHWVNAGSVFPYRSAVEAAIKDAGGTIEQISYTALPTDDVALGDTIEAGFWIPNPVTDPLLCLGWSAIVSFDYAQSIEENYTITVSAPGSIAEIGTVPQTMSGALEGVYQDITAVEINITLKKSDIISNPPTDQAAVVPGFVNAKTVQLSAETDREAAKNAIETLCAIAKTEIWQAHRGHAVSFQAPLDPAIDVDKTCSVDDGRVSTKGKVRKVKHTMRIDAGTAVSDVTLAICSVAGVGTNHADDDIIAPDGVTDGATEALAPPVVVFNGAVGQDQKLTITFPGVEADQREKAIIDITQAVAAGLVEDPLVIV